MPIIFKLFFDFLLSFSIVFAKPLKSSGLTAYPTFESLIILAEVPVKNPIIGLPELR